MAGKRAAKPWGDGVLDDTWHWAADVGAATGLALQVCLTPTRRVGVWRVVLRLLDMADGKPKGVRVQTAVEWPDASYTALPFCILQAANRLAILLEEDALQQQQTAP